MNRTYIAAGIVIVILLIILYVALAGSGTPTTTVSSLTTAVKGSHPSTFVSTAPTTTVVINYSKYTTIPPVANSTYTQPVVFPSFVAATTVNTILGGSYVENALYTNSGGSGIIAEISRNYNSTISISGMAITLTWYNTTGYAYSNYNKTYNFYNIGKAYNQTFYSSTYENASYMIVNSSYVYRGTTLNFYMCWALYSNYIVQINIMENNSTLTTPQLELLTQAQINVMSGRK